MKDIFEAAGMEPGEIRIGIDGRRPRVSVVVPDDAEVWTVGGMYRSVTVRWPDGKEDSYSVFKGEKVFINRTVEIKP